MTDSDFEGLPNPELTPSSELLHTLNAKFELARDLLAQAVRVQLGKSHATGKIEFSPARYIDMELASDLVPLQHERILLRDSPRVTVGNDGVFTDDTSPHEAAWRESNFHVFRIMRIEDAGEEGADVMAARLTEEGLVDVRKKRIDRLPIMVVYIEKRLPNNHDDAYMLYFDDLNNVFRMTDYDPEVLQLLAITTDAQADTTPGRLTPITGGPGVVHEEDLASLMLDTIKDFQPQTFQ